MFELIQRKIWAWERQEDKSGVQVFNIFWIKGIMIEGLHGTRIVHPAALGLILGIPKNFSLDVAEIYWQHCSELWTESW